VLWLQWKAYLKIPEGEGRKLEESGLDIVFQDVTKRIALFKSIQGPWLEELAEMPKQSFCFMPMIPGRISATNTFLEDKAAIRLESSHCFLYTDKEGLSLRTGEQNPAESLLKWFSSAKCNHLHTI
jgi:hypothetical protein